MRSHRPSRRRRGRTMRPVAAATVLALGLVFAAAFTAITAQENALGRTIQSLQAGIATEEARRAALSHEIEAKKTADYIQQKAQEQGLVKPGEGLIAVERAPSSGDAARADGGRPSRVARWIALFFGTR